MKNKLEKKLSERIIDIIKYYDCSPDDMAGFEIRIKQPVKFLEEVRMIIDYEVNRVRGGK